MVAPVVMGLLLKVWEVKVSGSNPAMESVWKITSCFQLMFTSVLDDALLCLASFGFFAFVSPGPANKVSLWSRSSKRCQLKSSQFTLFFSQQNSYITIFSIIKYQNVTYNGRAKTIFFGSTATELLLAMHGSQNYILLIFILISLLHYYCLCIHTSFTRFFSFFFSFLYNIHTAIYYLCIHIIIILLFLYFIFSYILFFYLCIHTTIVVDSIILLWYLYYFIILKAKINSLILNIL